MLNGQDYARLGIALAGSMLVHGLLLETRMPAVSNVKIGQASSTRFHFDIMLSKPVPPHHEDIQAKAASEHAGKLALHKSHSPLKVKGQKDIIGKKMSSPAPASPMKHENAPARTLGTAWNNTVNPRTMMMRARQLFFTARNDAKGLVRQSFPADKMARYHGKHCLLNLLESTGKEQGYTIGHAECDDPELLAELRTLPWDMAIPLPSGYALPYHGLAIRLAFDGFDISVGVSAIVD